jgi:hypothetical protein
MSADLAVQKAIRARLIDTSAVTALVPATSILDRNARPAPRPGIVIGDAQEVDEGTSLSRTRTRVFHTVHVWKTEPSREGVKIIAGEILKAIRGARLDLGANYHCADWRVSNTRTMSDPDGETSHAVIVVECLVEEVTV